MLAFLGEHYTDETQYTVDLVSEKSTVTTSRSGCKHYCNGHPPQGPLMSRRVLLHV